MEEVPEVKYPGSNQVALLPPAEKPSVMSKIASFFKWLAGISHGDQPVMDATKHAHWVSFTWAFFKELGRECYRTWRGEVLFSVVLLGFIYLINHNPVDLRTVLLGTAYALSVFAIWHAIRIPWKLYSEGRKLNWGWGVLGIGVTLGMMFLTYWTVAWFMTMQPKVEINVAPSAERKRIEELEKQIRNFQPFVESDNSLRRRTIRLADRIDDWASERRTNHPPYTYPDPNSPDKSAAREKAIAVAQKYDQETTEQFTHRFQGEWIGIVNEYVARGVRTGTLVNDAQQLHPAQYTMYEFAVEDNGNYSTATSRFRELAYHVDARDQRIDISAGH
jgi:hypothetical protein